MSQSNIAAYSKKEEIANTLSHGLGVILSVIGLSILLKQSDGFLQIISCSIYGASLILLYSASSLYHGIPHKAAKLFFKRLDHLAIYLLIAGTYTPFLLVSLPANWGWPLFFVIWFLALLGVILELKQWKPFKHVSLVLYLGMGWIILVAINPMLDHVDMSGLILLLAGGLFYSFGVIFYVRKQLAYNHAIWHLFVLAGSISHYFSILYYVI